MIVGKTVTVTNINLTMNDSTSDIWTNGLRITKDIADKIAKSRRNEFKNNIRVCGSKEDIFNHMNTGKCTNLVQAFFNIKSINNCVKCGVQKSKESHLERAHCNTSDADRKTLLSRTIDELYVDDDTPIKATDIYIKFLLLHDGHPIFALCKACHIAYDSPPARI
tara:strand:+ start:25658 stop:26152 length:495 start_codon:yes stop_codon:yes gene_type:complete